MKVLFDIDGFFRPADSSRADAEYGQILISFENGRNNYHDIFEQYYLGFRSTLFISEDTIMNKKEIKRARKLLRDYNKECAENALSCMKNHFDSGPPLSVDFLWIIRDLIVNNLKDQYPDVKKIELRLSMQPMFSARTVNQNTIIIPALTRSILLQCNMAIINSIYDFTDGFDSAKMSNFSEQAKLNAKFIFDYSFSQTVQNARHIFSYLLYCHDNLSVMHLPITGARSQSVVEYVIDFTNIQLSFIMAHEYAHILLNHFNDSRDKHIKENEADSFAINVLLSYVEKNYSKEILLAAIRWLFKYQLIEDKIGELVQKKKITDFGSSYEERRGKCQYELLTKFEKDGCSMFETIGFCMLVDLQKVLYDTGLELVEDILAAFEKSKNTGKVESWWKKIQR